MALWLLGRRGPGGVRAWTALAVAFGLLPAGAVFGVDVSVARQLGLVLFHVLATATVVGWPASSSRGAEAARSPALGASRSTPSRGPTAGRRFFVTFRMNPATPLSTAGGLG